MFLGSRTSLVLKNSYHSALRKYRRVTGKETPERTEMFYFFARELPLASREPSPPEPTCNSAQIWSCHGTSSENKEVDLASPFVQELRDSELAPRLSPSLSSLDDNDTSLSAPSFRLYDESTDNLQRTENRSQTFKSGRSIDSTEPTLTATSSLVRSDSAGAVTLPTGTTIGENNNSSTITCEAEGLTANILERGGGESFSSSLFPEDWVEDSGDELCAKLVADE
eukprot:gb/GECG01003824.1/.p1 GENE.gb/GECG01003824.1/~~gb/GECG01003824.1/.p1  ORF type:complete len:225 (+),score=22.39 gb/GECG01003824.1/:1-675(+)